MPGFERLFSHEYSLFVDANVQLDPGKKDSPKRRYDRISVRLKFIAHHDTPIQVTRMIDEDTYEDYGIWQKLEIESILDKRLKTHIWTLVDRDENGRKADQLQLPQSRIIQLLPPNITHSYFRIILK